MQPSTADFYCCQELRPGVQVWEWQVFGVATRLETWSFTTETDKKKGSCNFPQTHKLKTHMHTHIRAEWEKKHSGIATETEHNESVNTQSEGSFPLNLCTPFSQATHCITWEQASSLWPFLKLWFSSRSCESTEMVPHLQQRLLHAHSVNV